MKTCSILLLSILVGDLASAPAQTNNVTGGDFVNYTINGLPDPTFTFQRGVTYVFVLSGITFHPFWIKSALAGDFSGGTGAFSPGVVNNGATSGNVTFTVPADAPDTLFYQCGSHSSMAGTINVVTPPAPPTVKIVFIQVADFITLQSTGATGWSAFPEFRCGVGDSTWTVVANFTNHLANGTNTTTFPRLETICGATNVVIRVRNQQP